MSQHPAQIADDRSARTTVAFLGTLGPLHKELARYDLARLRLLVETIEPDLLGIEAGADAWESGDPARLAIEIREAVLPATRFTDTVVIPLGDASPDELRPPAAGTFAAQRAALVRQADRLLESAACSIDDPADLSHGRYVHLCRSVCRLEAAAAGQAGRAAWEQANDHMFHALTEAIRRDPGRRVLVAVQCRRIHVLEAGLRASAEQLRLARFEDLVPVARRDRARSA